MAIAETLTNGVSDKTAGTATLTVGTDASRVSGTLIVVGLAWDNLTATTPTISSISKPGGESASWIIVEVNSPQAAAAAGVRCALAYIVATVDWSAHSIVVTFSGNITAKAAAYKTFTGASATIRGTAVSGTGSTSPSTDSGTLIDDLILLMDATEGPGDGTLPTWTGSAPGTITSQQSAGTTGGSGVTNATVVLAYIIATASGSRLVTTGTLTDGGYVVVSLAPAAAASAYPYELLTPTPRYF